MLFHCGIMLVVGFGSFFPSRNHEFTDFFIIKPGFVKKKKKKSLCFSLVCPD